MKDRRVIITVVIAVLVIAVVIVALRMRGPEHLPAAITGPTTPIGAEFPKDQREMFAKQLEENFRAKKIQATITTSGDNATTLEMLIPNSTKEKANTTASNPAIISQLRVIGFKQITISNGKESWLVDLKN